MSIWAAIGAFACYTITIAGCLLFSCRTIKASWDPYSFETGYCINTAVLYIAIAVANIASDVLIFVFPIPTIVKLKMPLAQKIGAGIMFGIGSV